MPLTILAQITAEPGHESAVLESLKGLVEPTRAEDGCVVYDLHVDNSRSGFFVFYEIWKSRDLWQAHMQSPHLKAHGAETEGMVASVVINEMTQVA